MSVADRNELPFGVLRADVVAGRFRFVLGCSLAALLTINVGFVFANYFGVLPKFVSVQSGGMNRLPPLEKDVQVFINIGLLVTLIATIVLSVKVARFQSSLTPPLPLRLPVRESHLAVLLTMMFFAWGVYISYPPAISSINFRYLWVDWLGSDMKFRYIGQIIRHIFYEYPHILQGLAFAILFYTLNRITKYYRPSISALTLPFCVLLSGTFVVFSNLVEDWIFAAAANMLIFWAYLTRRWPAVILAFFLSAGIRLPEAAITLLSIFVVETVRPFLLVVTSRPSAYSYVLSHWLRLMTVGLTTILICYLGFLFFYSYGEGDFGYIFNVNVREIDGFTLSRFSGVYFGHFLWAMPVMIVASCFAVLFFIPQSINTIQGRSALSSSLSVFFIILFYEFYVERQLYYNIKYLSSTFLLGIPALLFIVHRVTLGWVFSLVVGISIFATTAQSNIVSTVMRPLTAAQLRDHQFYSCRHVLRPWVRTRKVFLSRVGERAGGNFALQYVAGVFVRPVLEGVAILPDDKTTFLTSEAVMTNDPAESRKLTEQRGLVEAATCRGWSILIPAPRASAPS